MVPSPLPALRDTMSGRPASRELAVDSDPLASFCRFQIRPTGTKPPGLQGHRLPRPAAGDPLTRAGQVAPRLSLLLFCETARTSHVTNACEEMVTPGTLSVHSRAPSPRARRLGTVASGKRGGSHGLLPASCPGTLPSSCPGSGQRGGKVVGRRKPTTASALVTVEITVPRYSARPTAWPHTAPTPGWNPVSATYELCDLG